MVRRANGNTCRQKLHPTQKIQEKKKNTSHGLGCLSGIKMHVLKTDIVFSFTRLKYTNRDAINVMIIEMPWGRTAVTQPHSMWLMPVPCETSVQGSRSHLNPGLQTRAVGTWCCLPLAAEATHLGTKWQCHAVPCHLLHIPKDTSPSEPAGSPPSPGACATSAHLMPGSRLMTCIVVAQMAGKH